MKQPYSYKRALGWAGGGLAACGLAGAFEATAHYGAQHFETLSQSFAHVAQPGNMAAALIVSASFGAFMEFRNWYYTSRAEDDAAQDAKRRRPKENGLKL